LTSSVRNSSPERDDLLAALDAASEACHANPHLPEPHYAYGEAWAAWGDHAKAEQAFAAALQRNPAWADAWVNYGLAHYHQGAVEDAKTAMRQALRCAPGHAAAMANLSAFLRLTGQREDGEALLREGLAADPLNHAARLNLVADLLQEERLADALDLLVTAPALPTEASALRHWRLQAALALLQLGHTREAVLVLAAVHASGPLPAEVLPLWYWRHVLLALALGDTGAARSAAEAMQDSLDASGPKAEPERQIMARYDLAKFWSSQQMPAAAMTQWKAGHHLLKRTQPFSRAAHLAEVEANIAAFSAARFAAGPLASNADPAPIFIVGMPRSGTTLCEQIVAAHPQVHDAGERVALGRLAYRLAGEDAEAAQRLAAMDVSALDAAADDYLASMRALAPDKARVLDKMPGNYMHLGLAGVMLPGARFIHCQRDPRDIGLSIFTARFHGSHGYAHDLADLGWTIAQQLRLMEHWAAAMPGRVLMLRLADWARDFEGTLARVLAHVGLPHDDACARFCEGDSRVRTLSRSQVRRPVYGRGLGRWRAYSKELQPLIAELKQAGALDAWEDII
jgi:tetratricopeptide (TPR) repeat protein